MASKHWQHILLRHYPEAFESQANRAQVGCVVNREEDRFRGTKSIGRKLAASLEDILYGPREIEWMQKNLQRWPQLLINNAIRRDCHFLRFTRPAGACGRGAHTTACTNDATNPFDQFLSLSLSLSYCSPKSDRANCSSYRIKSNKRFAARQEFQLSSARRILIH